MESKDMVRANISLDQVRAAKAELRQHFGKSVDIVGIGVTGREGRYTLKVNVRRLLKGRILPSEINGVRVKFEVVGAIGRGSSTVRISTVRSGSLFGAHPGSVRIKRGVDLVTVNPVLDE